MVKIIVIEIDLNTMRDMATRAKGMSVFYTEDPFEIIVYNEFNGMLFRYVYRKVGGEADSIWVTTNLMNATEVIRISKFGSENMRESLSLLYDAMAEIHYKLEDIEGRIRRE